MFGVRVHGVAPIGAILGALALAGAATAADNGASVTNASWCTASSPFVTVCQDVKYVLKVETTPSGNVSYVMNGTTAATASIPLAGCTTGETDEFNEHWLSRDGELQTEARLWVVRRRSR
jgi:hypothetical protein